MAVDPAKTLTATWLVARVTGDSGCLVLYSLTITSKMSSKLSSAFSKKVCDVAGSLGLFCVHRVWQ